MFSIYVELVFVFIFPCNRFIPDVMYCATCSSSKQDIFKTNSYRLKCQIRKFFFILNFFIFFVRFFIYSVENF
jgi:hypothetical protein